MDFTVVIPTHNGATRLPKVLARLRSQVATQNLTWEVIICDNNSSDGTAAVVQQEQQDWLGSIPLRYCFVPERGTACARQRGVEMAQGEWIGFLDDDNLPTSDWVVQACRFGQERPKLGAFGSQIHGHFDQAPPLGFDRIACFLAIIERGNQPHIYDQAIKVLPPGAGLVVRRTAWLAAVPQRLVLNHRGREAGWASEDLEAVIHLRQRGWEIWHNPHQVVHHHIPPERLETESLRSLFRCIGHSRLYIRLLGHPRWRRPWVIPLYMANDLRRWAWHCYRQWRSPAQGEAAQLWEACERTYLKASLVSPLKLAQKAVNDNNRNASKQNDGKPYAEYAGRMKCETNNMQRNTQRSPYARP